MEKAQAKYNIGVHNTITIPASFYTTVGACYCYENYNECDLEQRREVR